MDLVALKAILYCALGLGVLIAWIYDRNRREHGQGMEGFWPGTTRAPAAAYLVAASGAILITLAETIVELRCGLTDKQGFLPAVFIFQLIGASIVEEMVFRGFFAPGEMIGGKLLALMIGGSVVFALIHNFDLASPEGRVNAIFAFMTSLWLYVTRFNPLNVERSLLPCFMAHIVRNLAVFGIKWAQGYIT